MSSRVKFLILCGVYLVIAALGVFFWKFLVQPKAKQEAEQFARKTLEQENQKKILATSADPLYKYHVNLALDGFSGYSVLRSSKFVQELARKSIKIDLSDDAADYVGRLNKLRSGEVQVAAFTVDALIKASAVSGDMPATIVAIMDETRGADAAVAYKTTVPNVDALNDPSTKFVVTKDSPSETLARVVIANFNFDRLGSDPFVYAKDADEVYKEYIKAKPDTRQVFVLWEPLVSKMLDNPNTHVIIDSSRFRGYIVDVLVVNRDFLFKNQALVSSIVESYFRAAYAYRSDMKSLVMEDAKKLGTALSEPQANNLVNGIWWKNTQENYAHFGLDGGQTLQHIEDMIENLTKVLLKTQAISSDPTNGQSNLLYYPKILQDLHAANFHPGILPEKISELATLPPLSDSDWEKLIPVGTLEVPQLVFNRGTDTLSPRSVSILDSLNDTLKTFPQYYVLIRGNASTAGNASAAQKLALDRAKTAEKYLVGKGVHKNRIKAIAGEPTGDTSVTFVLGQTSF